MSQANGTNTSQTNLSDAPWRTRVDDALALHASLRVAAPYFEYYGYDSLFAEQGASQCDLQKLDTAHIRLLGVAVANGSRGYFQVGPDELEVAGDSDWAHERLLKAFDAGMATITKCQRVRLVKKSSDVDRNDEPDAINVLPLVTGHAWMRSADDLRLLFDRGLRMCHVASLSCDRWCRHYPVKKVAGRVPLVFNDAGRELVSAMNELGVIIDLAHCSDESSAAILEVSKRPLIDGHTSSRTIVPRCRGHEDATLKRIADGGGVVGIHFADHMFCPKVWDAGKYGSDDTASATSLEKFNRHLLSIESDPDRRMTLRKDRSAQAAFYASHGLTAAAPPPQQRLATVADMADHVEHLVNVMGVEHVGLGGDVNGITLHSWPVGCDHVGELPHMTAELLRRGWAENDLAKFLAGNWSRVFRECLPESDPVASREAV
jgi:microsomal dipeptidase-like Zn-dependent dipeptidase